MSAALGLLTARQAVPLVPIPDKEDSDGLEPGTKILLKTMTPPGVSKKLYSPWKGGYVIRKRCDKYTYIVTPVEAPRRRFLVHRDRIRVLHPLPEDLPNKKETRQVINKLVIL